MQLRNYSILSTKNAEKLLINRYKRTPNSKKNYVRFKYGQIYQQPHHYFLYKDLNSTKATLAPNVKSFSNQKDALLASKKLALNEALHPEKYGLGVKHKTLSGKIKKFDRIDSGKHHLKFDTPQSSNKLFHLNKAFNMRKRSNINQLRNEYKNIKKHHYYGHDIFRNNRKIAYSCSLKHLNQRYPLKRQPQQMNLFDNKVNNKNAVNVKAYLRHNGGFSQS